MDRRKREWRCERLLVVPQGLSQFSRWVISSSAWQQLFLDEFLAKHYHHWVIHVEYLNSDAAYSRLADDPRSVESEVEVPFVLARMEEADQSRTRRLPVDPRQIRPLESVAMNAAP